GTLERETRVATPDQIIGVCTQRGREVHVCALALPQLLVISPRREGRRDADWHDRYAPEPAYLRVEPSSVRWSTPCCTSPSTTNSSQDAALAESPEKGSGMVRPSMRRIRSTMASAGVRIDRSISNPFANARSTGSSWLSLTVAANTRCMAAPKSSRTISASERLP